MKAFRFADCDYCKVSWFGSALPKPWNCSSLVSISRILLAEPGEWEDGGKRIYRACMQETQLQDKTELSVPRQPMRFCRGNDMDIEDTFPELDAVNVFEEEV